MKGKIKRGGRETSSRRHSDTSKRPIRSSSCTSSQPSISPDPLSWIHRAPTLENPHDPNSVRRWKKEFFEWWIRQKLVGFVHHELFRLLPVDLQGGTSLAIRAIDVALRRLYLRRRNAPSGWRAASSLQSPDVIARAVLAESLQELIRETSASSSCVAVSSRNSTKAPRK